MDIAQISDLDDLKQLIDIEENIRLDFKSSLLFYDGKTGRPDKNKYVDTLSKEVSGFANTEGGQIIVGLETTKGNNEPDKAIRLDDGIAFKDFNPEVIQRRIEASISPPLPGLRFLPIRRKDDTDRYYLVIVVPKGNTAYQAKSKMYYGRSEYETSPLHDSVIRLLMTRETEPHAIVKIDNIETVREDSNTDGQFHCRYEFDILIENDGEIDIDNFKVLLKMQPPFRGKLEGSSLSGRAGSLLGGDKYIYRDGWPAPVYSPYFDKKQSSKPIAVKIYPKDNFLINHYKIKFTLSDIDLSDEEYLDEEIERFTKSISSVIEDAETLNQYVETQRENLEKERLNSFQLSWVIYLPNTQPVQGNINLEDLFERPKVA